MVDSRESQNKVSEDSNKTCSNRAERAHNNHRAFFDHSLAIGVATTSVATIQFWVCSLSSNKASSFFSLFGVGKSLLKATIKGNDRISVGSPKFGARDDNAKENLKRPLFLPPARVLNRLGESERESDASLPNSRGDEVTSRTVLVLRLGTHIILGVRRLARGLGRRCYLLSWFN